MAEISLATQRLGDTEIIQIEGAVDSNSFPTLAEIVNRLLKNCRRTGALPQVILDCSRIQYIGSSEFQGLLSLASRARSHGGDIKCAHLAPTIEQLGNLIANGDQLDCLPEINDALLAFRHSPVEA